MGDHYTPRRIIEKRRRSEWAVSEKMKCDEMFCGWIKLPIKCCIKILQIVTLLEYIFGASVYTCNTVLLLLLLLLLLQLSLGSAMAQSV